MSLYRNWRPRSFADLVGQDTVVRTLSQALTSGRLVHAYLFSGPRGSGKTSAAKILARCITCQIGPTPTPDNDCEHCRSIFEGTALDVVEIDAASNRGIDEIRALRDAVKFAPSAMRKKVYIIDEVHMLTKEGANAFLKTLEEPPPHAVFILATTDPQSLPVTILSRCQRFAFRRISTAVMVDRMRHISDAENIAIDDSALGAIAYRADGGLRDALTMLEQAASFAQGTIDLDTIEAAFGSSGRVFAAIILDAFIASDAPAVLRAIEQASDAGTEMNNLIRSLVAELRHVVVARIDQGLLSGDLVEDDAQRARQRAEVLPQARALRALRLLADALAQARTSGNPRLELESAMLRLTLQGEDSSLEALSSRVRQLEEQLAQGGIAIPAAPPRPAVAAAPQVAVPQLAAPPAPAVAPVPKKETKPKAVSAPTPVSSPTPEITAPSPAVASTPVVLQPPDVAQAAVVAQTPVSAAVNPVSETSLTMAGSSASVTPPEISQVSSLERSPFAPPEDAFVASAPGAAVAVHPEVSLETVAVVASAELADTESGDDSWPSDMPEPEAAPAEPAPTPVVAAKPKLEPVPPPSNEPPTMQRALALWPNVVARAESKIASLRGPLSRTTITGVKDWTVHVQVADEYNASILRSRQAPLEAAIAEVLGPNCQVAIGVGSGTRQRNAKKEVTDQAESVLGLLDYAAKRLGS